MEPESASMPARVGVEELGAPSQHDPLMHAHEGLELVRVDEGCMDCIAGTSVNRLEAGDVCLINAGRMHRAREVEGHRCTYSVMHLDPAKLTRDEDVYARYIAPVLEDESFDFMLGCDCAGTAGEICRLMDQIAELERERPQAYELEVIALAHLVFKQIYLRRHALADELAAGSVSQDDMVLRAMTSLIYERYAERISLEDIARAGGVSRSKASAVFKARLGTSPIEFLNRYRLEVAAIKLVRTDDTIARIASSCGFSQQSYFNRVFGRAWGMTPKQYRAAQRQKTAA